MKTNKESKLFGATRAERKWWYQTVMSKQGMDYYNQKGYATRNAALSKMVINSNPKRVFDFAGSGGYLALEILKNCDSIIEYVHSDFAPVAVEKACEILSKFKNCRVENIDIMTEVNNIEWGKYDTFICISWEHIENDIEVVSMLPKGSNLFLSIATQVGGESHVNIFSDMNDVRERYGGMLDFIEEVYPNMKNPRPIAWARKI